MSGIPAGLVVSDDFRPLGRWAGRALVRIIPLFAAAWAPAVIALLSGVTLLFYTEDG